MCVCVCVCVCVCERERERERDIWNGCTQGQSKQRAAKDFRQVAYSNRCPDRRTLVQLFLIQQVSDNSSKGSSGRQLSRSRQFLLCQGCPFPDTAGK